MARSEVQLTYLPEPDFFEFSLPDTHVALVTNDGTAFTTEVVRQLQADGIKAVVLNLPESGEIDGVPAVSLRDNSDEGIKKALEQVRSTFGDVGAFIHLHPHLTFENGRFAQHFPREKEIVKTVFLLAKHLQQPLVDFGKSNRAAFMTVTRMDGKLGLGGRPDVSVVGGGLTGLIKSLNLEWSPVFCRALDLQPELSDSKKAAQVIAELHDADLTHTEVGVSEEGRRTLSAKPVEVAENREISTTVTSDSVFLVSGGARGVTATCVIEMAKAFQCKFILMGRSSDAFELPGYARQASGEGDLKRLIMEDLKQRGEKPSLPKVKELYKKITAKKEIEDTLQAVESHGGKAYYLQGDVTDIGSFRMDLQKLTQQTGSVTGIIHGAGRLADKYIQDKTATDFENVLSVKLHGLLTLLQCVNLNKLNHLILFSSVAGFYGNVGQTDYAIANEVLSKAAHLFKRNHPGTHVSAINWGAWDAGMVSPELKKKLEEAGVSLVNSEGGAAMLINELSTEYAGQPQAIIGGTLPAAVSYTEGELQTYKIRRKLTLEENEFLNHHVIQGKPVLPTVNAVSWMAQTCERLYPDFRIFTIEDAKLFKGVVFDGTQPEEFTLELKEVEKGAEKVRFEVTLSSRGKKLPVYHYKAKVTLVPRSQKVEAPTFEPTISGEFEARDGAYVYEDGSLFHDTYYQGIERIVDWNDKQIILACKAPEVPLKDQGQFPVSSVNAYFSDIQYQGLVLWVQRYKDGAKSLPLRTDSVTIYRPIPFEKELFVHVKVKENSDFRMVADCTVYDDSGTVFMTTKGAAVTISKELQW